MTKKIAWGILLAVVITTAMLSSVLPKLYFDYNFDGFFNPDEPATRYYKNHQATFGTDNDFILVAIEGTPSVFDPAFLQDIDSLAQRLEQGPHVKRVFAPTNFVHRVQVPLIGGIIERPIYRNGRIDSLEIAQEHGMARQLFSEELDALSLVVLTDQKLSKKNCDEVAQHIFQSIEALSPGPSHVSGRAIGQGVYIEKIQGEFFLFMCISLVFVVLLLYIMFRNAAGVVIPLVVVLLSIIWTLASIHFLGRGISLLMSMIPPVIFVVGMSDVVHLYARFIEEKSQGKGRLEAIRIMLNKTGLATLITSITTAIGFATLYFTGIPSLQDFGLITALGVLFAFLLAILVLPAILVLVPIPESKSLLAHRGWNHGLEKWYDWVIKHKQAVRASALVLTGILALLAMKIERNNYLLEDLKPGIKVKDDFDYFDREFSGVRPVEFGIKSLQNQNLLNPIDIEHLATLEAYLDSAYGLRAINSLVQLTFELNRSRHGGKQAYHKMPESQSEWKKVLSDLKRLQKMGKLKTLINETGNYTRISGRTPDRGAAVFAEKNEELTAFIAAEPDFAEIDIQLTGTGSLIDRTNQNLIYNLAKGLGIAFVLIAALMGMLFKSLKMMFIALVPNFLPILAVAAVMAVFHIDLKLSTGIIFTIAFGIAVDDTIHILSRYKLELLGGASEALALRKAIVHTGKALVITSLILFGGFLSLSFSSFQSTAYIGLLVTVTLIFALFFDLSLLPAILGPKKENTKRS